MKKMTGVIVAALVMVWAVAGFGQTILTGGGSTPGAVVRGAASQSANLQEWQNGKGTVVASVDPGGKFTGDGSGLSGVEKRIDISACGTISQSGSYYVTQNLSTTGTCLEVTTNDVTIDLNGFTLTGDGSGTSDYGVYINNYSNVEVKNGTVRNFYYGIFDVLGSTNRVINVRAMGNGYGIYLEGANNLVRDCSAADSPVGNGILVGVAATVTNNKVYNNQGTGIATSSGSIVINNTVYNNQNRGISISYNCNVTGNTVYNNQANGIYADDGSTVANNTVRNNQGDGIHASSGTVTGNTVYNNQGHGISATACTVTGNTVRYSQGRGISAAYGSTVSNNTAFGNNQSNNASHGGIFVDIGCVVKNNTVRSNLQNNILVGLSENAIEENLVTDSGNGISFSFGGNFYANNRARGNTTNYDNGGSQTDGGGNVGF